HTLVPEGKGYKKVPVQEKDFFKEEVRDGLSKITFVFPNLTEGAIIEYRYKLVSTGIRQPRTWYFQNEIPTLWSEVRLTSPMYFEYTTLRNNLKPFTYDKKLESTYQFGIEEDVYNVMTQTALENIPPLEEEPYITNIDDLRQRMEFQLSRQNFKNGLAENYLSTWPEFNTQMMQQEYVGDQIEKTVYHRKLKLAAKEVLATIKDQKDPIKTLYDFVQDQVKWNGEYSKYTEHSLDRALDQKSANSGEMNMMFIRLLKEAGFEANPVLIATRSYGKIEQTFPVANKFNHLITAVKSNEAWQLIDVSHPNYDLDLLPIDCLNDVGFMMNLKEGPQWINIDAPVYKERSGLTVRFEEDQFNVTVQSRFENYAALLERQQYANQGNTNYFKNWSEEDLTVTKGELLSDKNQKTIFATKLSFEKEVDLESEFLYLNPMFGYNLTDNPFDAEQRNLPVDFPYPIENDLIISLQIPENMEIVELPESQKFQLPNKDGMYQYQVNNTGNTIQIRSRFELNRTFYKPDQYEQLKDLFDYMLEKQNELIVLKMKANK
ncbi:MAG: DUF3858 domain-containing protein, partial [Bacteroidota bacterium]